MAAGTSRETFLEVFDRIRLSRWSVQAAIGAYDEEKLGTQELILDLAVWGDFRPAADSDRLEDALDYAALRSELESWMSGRRWALLEAFAEQVCRRVLEFPLVGKVELTVEKPLAQAPAMVSYTISREK